jgi:putative protein kinase ArgK-like GTPase of G3E family
MNLSFTHRGEREALDRAITKVEKAEQYNLASQKWLDSAHAELGDRPIKIKLSA